MRRSGFGGATLILGIFAVLVALLAVLANCVKFVALKPGAGSSQRVAGRRAIRLGVPSACGFCSSLRKIFPGGTAPCKSIGHSCAAPSFDCDRGRKLPVT